MEISVKIPEDLEFLNRLSNIDLSIAASKLLKSKLERVSRFQEIVSKSKLTEKDVEELSDKINKSLSKRYLE